MESVTWCDATFHTSHFVFSYFVVSVSHLAKVVGSFVIGLGGGLGVSCRKFRMLSIGCILGLFVITMCLKLVFFLVFLSVD